MHHYRAETMRQSIQDLRERIRYIHVLCTLDHGSVHVMQVFLLQSVEG